MAVCGKQVCGVVRSRRFLSGVGVGFLTILGVGIGQKNPTPDVQLGHFLHHTPKLGIPVEMVQFFLKLLLKHVSCCAPRFPLILTVKFHSLYVKESQSEILERSESDILPPTPQPWWKVLFFTSSMAFSTH